MGVISKGGIRGGKKRPGRACQHCDYYREIRLRKCSLRFCKIRRDRSF